MEEFDVKYEYKTASSDLATEVCKFYQPMFSSTIKTEGNFVIFVINIKDINEDRKSHEFTMLRISAFFEGLNFGTEFMRKKKELITFMQHNERTGGVNPKQQTERPKGKPTSQPPAKKV
jgi:hypothetical protein